MWLARHKGKKLKSIDNDMKKALLILGSDYGTIDLVREAHKMGLYVIVADLMESSPTKLEADEAWLISTTDTDVLANKCREVGVCGVVTGASDFNTTCSRKLCVELGAPVICDSDNAWGMARNKRLFKEMCLEVGAPVAKDYYIKSIDDEKEIEIVTYPVVVKPVDKSANRGMSYCNNKEELIEAFKYAKSISDNDTIIVEKELHGPEFAAHYVIAEGEARLLYFGSEHHQPGQRNNQYSLVYTTSAYLQQYLEEVNGPLKEVFRRAGCKDGIAWVECIRDDDGHFYLFEMGYRFGATMLYTWYEKVYGFNSIRWMIECAIGIKHTTADLPDGLSKPLKSTSASYHLFTKRESCIVCIKGLEVIGQMDNVIIDIPKRGEYKAPSHACIGVIRVFGENANHLCETITFINKHLRIEDASGENIIILFDDIDSIKTEYALGMRQFGIIEN